MQPRSRNPFGSQVDFFKRTPEAEAVNMAKSRNPFGSQVDFFKEAGMNNHVPDLERWSQSLRISGRFLHNLQ
mgnify:CR=1 FL=1